MIEDIDSALIKIDTDLKKYADTVNFIDINEFTLDALQGNVCDSKYNVNGIYRFDILVEDPTVDVQGWLIQFTEDWKNPDVIWVPGIKKNRMLFHTEYKKWMPIYIGKSKWVGKRINEHLHQKTQANTFGMKLMGRTNLYGRKFKVSWIPLGVTHYNLIAPTVEGYLRNRFNPIIGKQ